VKIYTKTGDNGTTALTGGTRVSKDAVRVEAYGTVDELISWIGVLRAGTLTEEQARQLRRIQECLMTCAALLSADENTHKKLPTLTEEDIQALETAIDHMQAGLPALRAFVLPAGPPAAAMCHVARSVCRRAERRAVTVAQQSAVDPRVLHYLNRLSDYLFSLSRQLTIDHKAPEDCWLP
jgi:cob(I)alamin adenosyltransferase